MPSRILVAAMTLAVLPITVAPCADPALRGHQGLSPRLELGLVSRVTPVHTATRNYMRDEWRSLRVSNRLSASPRVCKSILVKHH